MKLLEKVFIAIVVSVFSVSLDQAHAVAPLFFGLLPPHPPIAAAANIVRMWPAAAVGQIDISEWDNALPSTVADDLFLPNAFGPGIPNNAVVHEMFHCFRNHGRKPHVALARIVICGIDGNRYIFPIPYVFVSGRDHVTAILKWNTAHLAIAYPNLANAIQQVALPVGGLPPPRPIDNMVKSIGDYGFQCQLLAQYSSFAHSERAAILCLLYDVNYSIANAVAIFKAAFPGVAITEMVVQIKIAHVNGVCPSCKCFFKHRSGINAGFDIPNIGVFRPRPVSPACTFGNPTHAGNVNYLVRNYMSMPIIAMGINIQLRISHITVGIPAAIPGVPLATAVNGF